MTHENLSAIQRQHRANNQRNSSGVKTGLRLFSLFCAVALTVGGKCGSNGFTIDTPAVPDATNCQPYTATIMVSGIPSTQSGPMEFAVTSGALPPGISLTGGTNSSVTLSGTPTTPGTYNFTISASVLTTSGVENTSKSFTIVVSPGPCGMPVLTSLSPNNATQGSGNVSVTINGMNFVAGATVSFGTVTLTPSSISPTQIMATIPSSALANAGTVPVTVTDSGGTSNALTFTINTAPAPTISTINPVSVVVGSDGVNLVIAGTNFGRGTVVNLQNSLGTIVLNPSSITSTQVTVTVPDGAFWDAISYMLTLDSFGQTSNAVSLPVTDTVKSYSPGVFFPGVDIPATDADGLLAFFAFIGSNGQVFKQNPTSGAWSALTQLGTGQSISASQDGNTVLTCVPSTSPTGTGTATVFEVQNRIWPTGTLPSMSLTPSTPASPLYGSSCSLSADGNTAVVGDLGNAAYIFTKGNSGSWSQSGVLSASGAGASLSFAISVSVAGLGKTIAVGDPGGSAAPTPGQVNIYDKNSTGWPTAPSSVLQGSGAGNGDLQGLAVQVSADGNTAVVGGPGASGGAGSAWLFTRSTGTWLQTAKLTQSSPQTGALFGRSVAGSSDLFTVFVGAPGAPGGGAVAIFQGPFSGTMTENQILTPFFGITYSGGTAGFTSNFGVHVAVSEDGTVGIVGGNGPNSSGSNQPNAAVVQ